MRLNVVLGVDCGKRHSHGYSICIKIAYLWNTALCVVVRHSLFCDCVVHISAHAEGNSLKSVVRKCNTKCNHDIIKIFKWTEIVARIMNLGAGRDMDMGN